jgi:hypothetical protein
MSAEWIWWALLPERVSLSPQLPPLLLHQGPPRLLLLVLLLRG